ncbi:recombinase family protein [Acuticoccus sp. MNP-M23]|uniref:recombinase family protein n=1 Tax=Acuticoccus sp. MNP-M23 TaxID=3072793 RepID=UPI0035C23988
MTARSALEPIIVDVQRSGRTSLRAIAEELNECGIVTRRGGRWYVSNVRNLLGRLGRKQAGAGR